MNGVILRKGKEKAIKNRHHWIFSGAIEKISAFTDGDILPVFSSEGEPLGSGYFNRQAKIMGRMVCFDETPAMQAIERYLDAALEMRRSWFNPNQTNAYRLINGEGDCLPGLVVDKYDDLLVVQISTLGMEKLKPFLVDYLLRKLTPRAIYEKSLIPARKEEGLKEFSATLYGECPSEIQVMENGVKFFVSVIEGQKTGFFLDHREMRKQIGLMARNKRVLNCFSYSGGFSLYAAIGGATQVDSVDISEKAIDLAKRNKDLNGLSNHSMQFFAEDVFQFLRSNPLEYDIVILDPPAFAKRQKDIIPACRGYKDINRVAMQKMPSKSILLSCSCSYYVDESLFQKVLFQASVEAGRTAKIIGKHHLAPDHPVNLCHPESDYLKSFLIYLD